MKKIIKKVLFVSLIFGALLSSCTPNESSNIIYSIDNLPNNIERITDEALEYTLSETGDSYIVTNIKDKSIKRIQIPAMHNNKKIECIGSRAFVECNNLECVSFSNNSNIKKIDVGAFMFCFNLKTIVIPENVLIRGYAFSGCNNLTIFCEGGKDTYELLNSWNLSPLMKIIDGKEVLLDRSTTLPSYWNVDKEKLLTIEKNGCCYALIDDQFILTKYIECSEINTDMEIPSADIAIPSAISLKKKYKVTSIGDYAFANAYTNINVTIPNTITSIGNQAFYNCRIKSIEIPSSVSSLGYGVFGFCTDLIDITFTSSVKSIGTYAFHSCTSLKNVYYDGTIEDWCYIRFSDCEYYSNYSIDYGFVFSSGPSYETTNPMAYASHFYLKVDNEYQELSEIVIPDGIKNIGVYQFYRFKNIVSVSLPDSVTSIGDYAFSNCEQLKKINIPSKVTSIGVHVFMNCDNLEYNEYDNADYLGNDENPYLCLVRADTNLTSCNINPKTSIILAGAFYGCSSLTSIIIPSSVIFIGTNAFYKCTSLKFNEYDNANYLGNDNNPFLWLISSKNKDITSCIINKNTRYIYDFAFSNCKSLSDIVIPDNITYIGEGVFDGCESLSNVTLSNNLTLFGKYVFGNCKNLQYNELDDAYYLGSDDNPYLCLVEIKNKDIESFNINENTCIIYDNAFSQCKHLKDVFIHENIFYIGEKAFLYCYSLTIYCEMEVQPSTWNFSWNMKNFFESNRIPVVWGYIKE